MSYHAGIGPNLERVLGYGPREPHIRCDGCGRTHPVTTSRGDVAQWWLVRRASPPRWKGLRKGDGSRRWDLCPECLEDPFAADSAEAV